MFVPECVKTKFGFYNYLLMLYLDIDSHFIVFHPRSFLKEIQCTSNATSAWIAMYTTNFTL